MEDSPSVTLQEIDGGDAGREQGQEQEQEQESLKTGEGEEVKADGEGSDAAKVQMADVALILENPENQEQKLLTNNGGVETEASQVGMDVNGEAVGSRVSSEGQESEAEDCILQPKTGTKRRLDCIEGGEPSELLPTRKSQRQRAGGKTVAANSKAVTKKGRAPSKPLSVASRI